MVASTEKQWCLCFQGSIPSVADPGRKDHPCEEHALATGYGHLWFSFISRKSSLILLNMVWHLRSLGPIISMIITIESLLKCLKKSRKLKSVLGWIMKFRLDWVQGQQSKFYSFFSFTYFIDLRRQFVNLFKKQTSIIQDRIENVDFFFSCVCVWSESTYAMTDSLDENFSTANFKKMFVFDFNFWVNVLTFNSLLEKPFGFVLFHSYGCCFCCCCCCFFYYPLRYQEA